VGQSGPIHYSPYWKRLNDTVLKLLPEPDAEMRAARLEGRWFLSVGNHEVWGDPKSGQGNRWGHRDATMVLVAYRHSLRAAELVDLRFDQVDFKTAVCQTSLVNLNERGIFF
jgi:integrase